MLLVCYARYMILSGQELLHYLSRITFVDTEELAMILGKARVAIHRGLAKLMDGCFTHRNQSPIACNLADRDRTSCKQRCPVLLRKGECPVIR